MGYVLGVDLGTTYSAAAVVTNEGASIVSLANRAATIPSVVTLRADGEVLVGESAERRALTEPTRTAREFKRRLGDPTPLLLGGTPYGAETLMAHLLRWIVDKVTEQRGAAPDRIVLSHPANWGPYKLDLLAETVRVADVGGVTFITEPEAAAVHYAEAERLEPGEIVAVYDFGGGTFDAAVLRRTPVGFDLIGTPEGMERIGGIDFDQAVFAHVDGAVAGAVRELDPADVGNVAAVGRLRDECQSAKEALSQDTDVDIPVILPTLNTEVRLTRTEFEQMIRPRILETIAALERAIRSAGIEMSDVSKVLLVGGSSRIPLVGQLVREATGRPIALDAHPKHTIAIGAAILGAAGDARPVAAERAVAGELTAAAATAETVAPAEAVPAASSPDRAGGSRTRVVVGAAAALAAIGAVAAFALSGGDDPGVDAEPLADASPGASEAATPYPSGASGTSAGIAYALEDLSVDDAGTVAVRASSSGFTPGEGGYELEFWWNAEWSLPIPGVSPVRWSSDEPYDGYTTVSRPVAASGVCVYLEGPDGSIEPDYDTNCARMTTTQMARGLPDGRLVELTGIEAADDGRLTVTYTPYGFDPTMGGTGTHHVHFYWYPTSTEDTVGVNIPESERGSWVAWDREVFDAWNMTDAPADATHVCAVVGEHDHTIVLQADGTGYPTGTCLPYDEADLTSAS